MSSDGSVLIVWPDEERRYRLGIGELRELQDKCDAGPAQIVNAIRDGTWRVEWVRETIRLGLIGGGLDPQRALGIVGRYVVPGSLFRCAAHAATILLGALVGDQSESTEGKATAETSPNGSTSRPSTQAAPFSDGLPETSINAHSLNSRPQ